VRGASTLLPEAVLVAGQRSFAGRGRDLGAATRAEQGISASAEIFEWAVFMVYVPAREAVLLPQPEQRALRERQQNARSERQQTIINVYQNIVSVVGGTVVGAIDDD